MIFAFITQAIFASVALGAALNVPYSVPSNGLVARDNTTCLSQYKVVSGDGCAAIALKNNITLAQFFGWNPTVPFDCGNLYVGQSLCTNSTAPALPLTAVGPPAPPRTYEGVTDKCVLYHRVDVIDTVWSLSAKYGFTIEQFNAWNPSTKVFNNIVSTWFYCVLAPN